MSYCTYFSLWLYVNVFGECKMLFFIPPEHACYCFKLKNNETIFDWSLVIILFLLLLLVSELLYSSLISWFPQKWFAHFHLWFYKIISKSILYFNNKNIKNPKVLKKFTDTRKCMIYNRFNTEYKVRSWVH